MDSIKASGACLSTVKEYLTPSYEISTGNLFMPFSPISPVYSSERGTRGTEHESVIPAGARACVRNIEEHASRGGEEQRREEREEKEGKFQVLMYYAVSGSTSGSEELGLRAARGPGVMNPPAGPANGHVHYTFVPAPIFLFLHLPSPFPLQAFFPSLAIHLSKMASQPASIV